MDSITTRRLSPDREAEKASWSAIREICCRTGDNGRPIARERWDFFSKIWIDPYEMLVPQWTYVAVVQETTVGYLTGCPDSKKLSRSKAWRVTLPLLMQIVLARYRTTPGAREFARRALGLGKRPERSFPRLAHQSMANFYPAHLHVNVEERYRRMGIGGRLIENYLADLREQGVSGVHLYCAADPVEFYLRSGFKVMEVEQFQNGPIFALGRTAQANEGAQTTRQ